MKTIFRSVNMAVLIAVVLALGAVAGFAQDPTPNPNCGESAGITDLDAKVRAAYADKTIAGRKNFVNTGKQFLEKYGSCDSQKEFVDWLKVQVPKMETVTIPAMEVAAEKKSLVDRFNAGLKSKTWDEVYASGKVILTKYPDEFRDVELVLGTIGYDELYTNQNGKFNEDTIKYAKMALADIEAGKFKNFGIPNTAFHYKTTDEASGWMNLIVGYVTQVGQKNKKDAQPFLFKATQINSTANKQPIPFEMIGHYYFDELNKITKEVTALADSQKPEDTPEVAKQKVDEIEGKVALANGYAERAADAFARAYTLGAAKAYKDLMYKNLQDALKVRGKSEWLTPAWIADTVKKPLPNPTTPVTPISDPKPAATTTTGTAPATTPPTTPVKPPATTPVNNNAKPPAKPNGTAAPAKPGAAIPTKTPVGKRQASVKKRTVKKAA